MVKNRQTLFKKWTYAIPLLFAVAAFLIVIAQINPADRSIAFGKDPEQADVNKTSPDPNSPQAEKQKESREQKISKPAHKHPAFGQRSKERVNMVERQIRMRDISDPNVLASMRMVPRHFFVQQGDLHRAYDDNPLPIGFGQTISQPYIVAYMTEKIKLRPEYKVLEIGTGSGYQAAVCAEIAAEVYTIEIIEQLAQSAEQKLKDLGYTNIFVKAGDGYFGWEEKGPFDAIIVTAAAGFVPPPLISQLKPNGRMILPLGSPYGAQTLVLVTKDDKGTVSSRGLLPVQFVPMLGHVTEPEQQQKK
jgi:protein-L-isoaspartate(D-aspartate) O-methyltransferase